MLEKEGSRKSEPSRWASTCSPLGDTGMLRVGNSNLVFAKTDLSLGFRQGAIKLIPAKIPGALHPLSDHWERWGEFEKVF